MKKILKPTDRILVPFGTTRKIAKACGCHESTVAEALRGMRDTDTQRLIRKRAIEEYGGIW